MHETKISCQRQCVAIWRKEGFRFLLNFVTLFFFYFESLWSEEKISFFVSLHLIGFDFSAYNLSALSEIICGKKTAVERIITRFSGRELPIKLNLLLFCGLFKRDI